IEPPLDGEVPRRGLAGGRAENHALDHTHAKDELGDDRSRECATGHLLEPSRGSYAQSTPRSNRRVIMTPTLQPKTSLRADSQIAITAGCLSLRSTEIA